MKNKETLEEVCDKVLNYLIPDCKKEMSIVQYSNAMYALRFIADWQAERMHSEEEVLEIINSFEELCYNYQSNESWFPAKKSEFLKNKFKKK
jgi:hypothetical protein